MGTGSLAPGDQVGLVLDKTNFYAEQGGQVGDRGWIKTDTGSFEVEDTQRLGDSVIHWGKVWEGTIKTGQKATLEVHPLRLDTMRNHTATHLMNWALRKVLGDHVEQKGSLVDPLKTRFDFTHDKPMTTDEIAGSRTARQRQDPRGRTGDGEHDVARRSEEDPRRPRGLRREVPRPGARRHHRQSPPLPPERGTRGVEGETYNSLADPQNRPAKPKNQVLPSPPAPLPGGKRGEIRSNSAEAPT